MSKLTGKLDNVIATQSLEKKQIEKSQDQGRQTLMDDLKTVKVIHTGIAIPKRSSSVIQAENQRLREHVEELQVTWGCE